MAVVEVNVSMSLDGFVTGPHVTVEDPMGVGGERLHEWMFAEDMDPQDTEVLERKRAEVGAVVIGRRTFDLGLAHWGDTPFPAPSFVVTHRDQPDLVQQGGTFTFVTDGVARAAELARAAAGDGRVYLMGADITQQFLAAGLVDELHVQVVPVLLGAGTRLFDRLGHVELRPLPVIESAAVTHLRYQIR